MRRIALIIDTREQNPLDFSQFEDIRVERRKLWPGDYSLQAASRLVAIERKSVSDLIGTMAGGYAGHSATSPERFDRELIGLAGVLHLGGDAFILVEPDERGETAEEQINAGNYRAMIPPEKVWFFIYTIKYYWRIPVVLADSREHAAKIVVEAVRAADSTKRSWRPFDKWLKDYTTNPPPGSGPEGGKNTPDAHRAKC